MESKCYRALQRAQGKMLREYFSGVPAENLSKRYGYSVNKIKSLASDYKQGKIDIFDKHRVNHLDSHPDLSAMSSPNHG